MRPQDEEALPMFPSGDLSLTPQQNNHLWMDGFTSSASALINDQSSDLRGYALPASLCAAVSPQPTATPLPHSSDGPQTLVNETPNKRSKRAPAGSAESRARHAARQDRYRQGKQQKLADTKAALQSVSDEIAALRNENMMLGMERKMLAAITDYWNSALQSLGGLLKSALVSSAALLPDQLRARAVMAILDVYNPTDEDIQ